MKTKLSKYCIGIIGGAGPMAGGMLFQEIVQSLQMTFGCQADSDYPSILHLSFPFEDMLQEDIRNKVVIQNQLNECLLTLQKNGVQIAVIACNTLHGFLDPKKHYSFHLINMIQSLVDVIKALRSPLVLCSTTSAKLKLHQQIFSCKYLSSSHQQWLEKLIAKILAGIHSRLDAMELSNVINQSKAKCVVFGCTEFSVLNAQFPLCENGLNPQVQIIDANRVVAKVLCNILKNGEK